MTTFDDDAGEWFPYRFPEGQVAVQESYEAIGLAEDGSRIYRVRGRITDANGTRVYDVERRYPEDATLLPPDAEP